MSTKKIPPVDDCPNNVVLNFHPLTGNVDNMFLALCPKRVCFHFSLFRSFPYHPEVEPPPPVLPPPNEPPEKPPPPMPPRPLPSIEPSSIPPSIEPPLLPSDSSRSFSTMCPHAEHNSFCFIIILILQNILSNS